MQNEDRFLPVGNDDAENVGELDQTTAIRALFAVAELRPNLAETIRDEVLAVLPDMPEVEREICGIYMQRATEAECHKLTRAILEKRFGQLPSWVDQRLAGLTLSDVERVALAAIDASSLSNTFE